LDSIHKIFVINVETPKAETRLEFLFDKPAFESCLFKQSSNLAATFKPDPLIGCNLSYENGHTLL